MASGKADPRPKKGWVKYVTATGLLLVFACLLFIPLPMQLSAVLSMTLFLVADVTKNEEDLYGEARVLRWTQYALILAGMIGLGATLALEDGRWYVFAFAAVIITTDSCAQVFGKWFGKKGTFFPRISPNKSMAGAVAGLLGGVAVAVAAGYILAANGVTVTQSVFVALLAAAPLSMFGDLLSSALKRQLGVKDFGNYLPGIGGLLDRMDSWLPVFALAGLALYLPSEMFMPVAGSFAFGVFAFCVAYWISKD